MLLLRDLRLQINELATGKGTAHLDTSGTLVRNETDATILDRVTSGELVIEPGAVASLPFSGVTTGNFLLLASDGDLTFTVNGGAEVFQLKKAPGSTKSRSVLYWEGQFTGLELTNPGATQVSVLYAVAGI